MPGLNDWSSVELYFRACEDGKLGITQTMGPGYRIMSKVKWLLQNCNNQITKFQTCHKFKYWIKKQENLHLHLI